MEKRNGRILVADDEKEIREILELLLTAEGCRPQTGRKPWGWQMILLIYIFWT